MSQDKPAAPSAASIKTMAAELYGLTLDDAHAARIADELGRFASVTKSAGATPIDAAPGALFRQLLLATYAAGADAAGARRV